MRLPAGREVMQDVGYKIHDARYRIVNTGCYLSSLRLTPNA